MASVHPRPAGLPASSNGTPIKKRKVRKGTQSCWECKRRKIRCTFAAPTDSICDGCKSRQTKCISQEYQDEPPSAGRKVDRIKRMESIIEGLVKHNKSPSTGEKDVFRGRQDLNDSNLIVKDAADAEDTKAVNKRDSSPSFSIPMGLETSSPIDLCRYLISLWPDQSDLDYILEAPISISVLLHCVVCQPYDGYFEKYIAPARQLLQRPTEDLHPVLAARNMLLLVTLLISVPPATIDDNPSLRKNHRSLTVRVFNAATRLVTSNDDLMGSIEGIECAMLECMYLVNVGNLRRAWLANRRGMVLAQMMGMQTGKSTSSIVVLDHKTLDRVRPDYMWFRLVCADRHLSLLLGLPQATTENVFAAPGILESYPPLERFERIMTVACSLILQRNIAENRDLETTYEIDKTLQRASTLLPPQWWLMATLDTIDLSGRDDSAFKETVRLMNQFIYHHLLVQLHLPYMMVHSMADPRYDYSKMTVANSARAILTRFTAFHGTIISTAYCRCMDFIAFIAATTLCMAHIEARRQQYHNNLNGNGFGVLQPLLHQRLADRGLMQRLLELTQSQAERDVDPVAKRILSILGPMLDIEHNSFKGVCYSVSATDNGPTGNKVEATPELGDSSNAPHRLSITIPYFATIRIEHEPNPLSADPAVTQAELEESRRSAKSAGAGASTTSSKDDSDSRDEGSLASSHERQSRDSPSSGCGTSGMPTPSTGYAMSATRPANADWQDMPSMLDFSTALGNEKGNVSWDDTAALLDSRIVEEPYLLVPGLSTNVDEWALQGVDVALFSGLTHGSAPLP